MKLKIAAMAAILTVCGIGSASAGEFYGALRVGNVADIDVDGIGADGEGSYGAAIGYDFDNFLRVETFGQRVEAGFLGGIVDANAWIYGANAFADWDVTENVTLSVGAGGHWMDADVNLGGITATDGAGFGYQFAGAATIQVNDRVAVEAMLTEYHNGEMEFFGAWAPEVELRVATLGLILDF
ncbi:MAG: hypothetical protein AB7J28_15780 [Hyphomonadaceae bacterium]